MRILVIQTAFIGDVVLTTPFLSELRRREPKAHIDVVATPQGCEILKGLPGLRLHPLDKRAKGRLSGMKTVLASLDAAGPGRFDVVYSVHRSLRSLALGRKAKAARRVAFRSFWARAFGYETVPYPAYDDAVHYVDKPLALLGGAHQIGRRPTLNCDAKDLDRVRTRLAALGAGRGALVVSPFSVWGTKVWFADRFAKAAAGLARAHALPVVLIGSGGERERADAARIVSEIESAGGRVANLVGETTLGELKAIISQARLLIANDSAPVHVAAAFDVPTVAIFGPTVRRWGFFPLSTKSVVVERSDVSCRPCSLHGPKTCPRKHFRCMELISSNDVVAAAESLLAGS